MEGYFSYTLYGTEEELKYAKEQIEKLAQGNKDFERLNECFDNMTSSSLSYYMSGNMRYITFDLSEMMGDLCKKFKNLIIEGEGTDDACQFPYAKFSSPKGSDDYEESFAPIELDLTEFEDLEEDQMPESFSFYCYSCDSEIDVDLKSDETIEFECESCGALYKI